MANPVYRKKNCPQCGVEHRKKGPFCSQGCHNRHRGARSDETKAKISESKKEWYQTPEGMREKEKLVLNTKLRSEGRDTITTEDFYVEIPDFVDLDDYDGWQKSEDW
jgi:endogenous inhibitor of DNA gyrase (YacG/DUF329 family)